MIHAVCAGASIAVDAGDTAVCTNNGVMDDQRGFARDGTCDIGAFESSAFPVELMHFNLLN